MLTSRALSRRRSRLIDTGNEVLNTVLRDKSLYCSMNDINWMCAAHGEQLNFMNPLDVADYLSTANITLQTAFGMTYVENFLGLGTVILNSSVPKGKIYATAKDNIVLYYIPVNGADLGEVFDFTTDATGYIGIHEEPDYTNMTASDTR